MRRRERKIERNVSGDSNHQPSSERHAGSSHIRYGKRKNDIIQLRVLKVRRIRLWCGLLSFIFFPCRMLSFRSVSLRAIHCKHRKRRVRSSSSSLPYAVIASFNGRDEAVSLHFINVTDTGPESLSSPRKWMEYRECMDGTAGFYTVMRVDATSPNDSKQKNYTIWGKEFHLHRLRSSFKQFLHLDNITENVVGATSQSDAIILELIQHIQQSLWSTTDTTMDGIKILMLTLLWTPSMAQPTIDPIRVKGHICTSNELTQLPLYDPQPIKAVLAIPDTRGITNVDEQHDIKLNQFSWRNLPDRFSDNPRVKISSWCRLRRPLEKYFKLSNIGEVLLVKDYEARTWELLEGLTSNIFVFYRDGTLRSCCRGVLEGYAQSIVRKAAYQCNINISHQPITLQDALDGLWSEVFITSAIRIIVPVKELLIPDYDHLDSAKDMTRVSFSSAWNVHESKSIGMNVTLWKLLYAKILEKRGFAEP